jgi:hypothetical protein
MTIEILVRSDGPCDKCNGQVPLENDAVALVSLMARNPSIRSRHLLPVVQDGVQVCPGSPSRAQHLADRPRDRREAYPYNTAKEAHYRAAYAKLRKACADHSQLLSDDELPKD